MYYVYLLESSADISWYIGYSADLKKRVAEHNSGSVISTRSKRPWRLIYYESYINRLDAKKRERFLKSGSGRRFIKKQLKNYLDNH